MHSSCSSLFLRLFSFTANPKTSWKHNLQPSSTSAFQDLFQADVCAAQREFSSQAPLVRELGSQPQWNGCGGILEAPHAAGTVCQVNTCACLPIAQGEVALGFFFK